MIEFELDNPNAILTVQPKSALEKVDFEQLAAAVDPFLEANGRLAGLLIEVASFPGWESVGAMAAHFRFVRDHHKRIGKVALVTDSALGNVAERLAAHFVAAEIRHFPAGERDQARQWIIAPG
jgi:hypothetical protein